MGKSTIDTRGVKVIPLTKNFWLLAVTLQRHEGFYGFSIGTLNGWPHWSSYSALLAVKYVGIWELDLFWLKALTEWWSTRKGEVPPEVRAYRAELNRLIEKEAKAQGWDTDA